MTKEIDSLDQSLALKVLIVDDDSSLLRLIAAILRMGGYLPLSAQGGAEGLAFLDESPQPDLVILDLQMPEIDGRTFYRRARLMGYPGPVLLCSAYGAESARRELGATAAIAKPFDPDDLLSCVATLVPARGS